MRELTYVEFLESLREGKKLKRIDWDFKNCYIQLLDLSKSLYRNFYIRKTCIFSDGTQDNCSYSLDGDDLFAAKWVEFTEDK